MSLFQAIRGFFRGFQCGLAKGKVSRQAKEASERELKKFLRQKESASNWMGTASDWKRTLLGIGRFVLLIIFVVGGYALWEALDENGCIPHSKLTVVTFRNWTAGEYKNCKSPNVSVMDDAPQIDCSSDFERGEPKTFDVRFYGRTFREDLTNISFSWRCKRNDEADPAFTCDDQKVMKSGEGR